MDEYILQYYDASHLCGYVTLCDNNGKDYIFNSINDAKETGDKLQKTQNEQIYIRKIDMKNKITQKISH